MLEESVSDTVEVSIIGVSDTVEGLYLAVLQAKKRMKKKDEIVETEVLVSTSVRRICIGYSYRRDPKGLETRS